MLIFPFTKLNKILPSKGVGELRMVFQFQTFAASCIQSTILLNKR
uniref:Uncharacterized protein n=1 Tax=Rhizophora mucronata TaxID=61149 RepID=A0A2P2QRH7_RHIMU